MTAHQIELLKRTFRIIKPLGDYVSKLFYDKLFLANPSLRQMFKNDMALQGEKLMATIELVVFSFELTGAGNYQIISSMIKPLENMGKQHQELGVQANHYNLVGDALLWTFQKAIAKDFTDEVKSAWQEAYSLLAQAMLQGVTETTK